MSRRHEPGSLRAVPVRMHIECDGAENHPVRRIARVDLRPRKNLELNYGWQIGVYYVWHADNPANDYIWSFRETHTVRRFVCGVCRRDVPLRDDRLVKLVLGFAAMGRRHARLRELVSGQAPAAIVSKE